MRILKLGALGGIAIGVVKVVKRRRNRAAIGKSTWPTLADTEGQDGSPDGSETDDSSETPDSSETDEDEDDAEDSAEHGDSADKANPHSDSDSGDAATQPE